MIVCLVVAVVDILLLGVLLCFENKRRDKDAARAGAAAGSQEGELVDITDFQNTEFRYVY